jgi:GWxTD domain-containing protein
MTKIMILSLCCLFLIPQSAVLAAQGSSGALSIFADYSAFRVQGDTENSYVEIHYHLKRSQLNYAPASDGYVAFINFKLTLSDSMGVLIDTLSWKAANKIGALSALDDGGYLISDMVADIIPAGNYKVDLVAQNAEKSGHSAFDMTIPAFNGNQPALSSIELAYSIMPDTSSGKFVKNGLKVMPNPTGQFLRENKIIAVYAEGYGLDTTAATDSIFILALDIYSDDGKLVDARKPLSYRKPGESAVLATSFPIDSLAAGSYYLKMTLTDGAKSVSATKNFALTVTREYARRTILEGLFRNFPEANNISSEDDAAKFRDEITFIAAPDELKLFDSLNLTGRAAFQKDFWSRRDPDPSTPLNEFEVEHYKRFQYVQNAYGRFKGGKAGWRTDRGRVYLLYGDPSEIERFPPTIEARAWERWWYHGIEGGVYFVFVDFENAEDYTLIHSSMKNEIKDNNWEDKVKMSMDLR